MAESGLAERWHYSLWAPIDKVLRNHSMDVARLSRMTEAAMNLTCGPKNFWWCIMTSAEQLAKQLEPARRDLLDLSSTNRLLTMPRHTDDSTAIKIMAEFTMEIYRILMLEDATRRFEEGGLADDETRVVSGESETVAGSDAAFGHGRAGRFAV